MKGKKHNLLICGIGRGMCSALNEIKNLEVEVDIYVISDYLSEDIKKYSKCYEIANPKSDKEVLRALSSFGKVRFDGIINLGYENLFIISKLVKEYNVIGVSELVARSCTNKNLRLSLLRNSGVNVPNFFFSRDVREIKDYILSTSLPVVVKPNNLTSSQGVCKISSEEEINSAIEEVASYGDLIVVEEYVGGSEHIFEGVVIEGDVFISGHADRNYSDKELFYPYFFENGDNLPSKIEKNKSLFQQVVYTIKSSLSALGIDNTPFHCDLILNGETIVVQEITARIAGGEFATKLVPKSNGISLIKNIVRKSLGLQIVFGELDAKFSTNVISRYFPSKTGLVSSIGDLDSLLNYSDKIIAVNWEKDIKVGDQLREYKSGKDMVASIILADDDIEKLDELSREVFLRLPIEYKKSC